MTGPDHAETNLNVRRYCGGAFHVINRSARNRVSAAATSAGVYSNFKVHVMATYPGPFLSGAREAFSAGHSVARRGGSALDCRTGTMKDRCAQPVRVVLSRGAREASSVVERRARVDSEIPQLFWQFDLATPNERVEHRANQEGQSA